MGGDEASARILNAAHTMILHAVPDLDPIIKAAGTKNGHRIQRPTRARPVHRPWLDALPAPDARRSQRGPAPATRDVFRDRHGKGQKIQIAAALGGPGPPPPIDIFAPPEQGDSDEPGTDEPVRL